MKRVLGAKVRVVAIAATLALSLLVSTVAACSQSDTPSDTAASADSASSTDDMEDSDSSLADSPSPSAELDIGEMHMALGAASTGFGFDLFSALLTSEAEAENLLVSPSSVAIALMMTHSGAAGDTQAAMAEALRLPDATPSDLNAAYGQVLRYLEQGGSDVELAIANSLWVRQDVELNPEFVSSIQESFEAEVAALDFSDAAAADTINNWVSDQTQGKIPAIVGEINPEMALFLINAIYFNGDWRFAFDPEATSDRPFTRLDSSQIDHPLMEQTRAFDYLETDQVQAIRLPYGSASGGATSGDTPAPRISMTVILPRESLPWSDFLASLSAETWQGWQSQFENRDGTIVLPRFQFEDQMPLNEPLKALGMAIAFDPSAADFSNLSSVPTVISQVQHRSVIDVTETGTEAAASTSVGVAVTSVPAPSTPFNMVVDRPFVFAIADETTQTLLFLGTVVDPATSGR